MSKLTDVIANLNKKFKTDIITTDSNGATFSGKERVNFPDPAFDYLFYGGFFTHTLWEASGEMSGGKAQPMYSKVLTENGWKEFKDIRLFDKIYCEDGKLHEVIGIFPQGERDIYEVSFTDGKVFRCSDEHLFEYTTRKFLYAGKDKWNIVMLKDLIEDFKENPSRQSDYYFKNNNAMEFAEKQYKMPPYIVGLFLGDGHINSHCMQFINSEDDILQTMIDYGVECNCKVTVAQKKGCKCITYSKPDNYKGNKQDPSAVKKLLMDIGLFGTMSHTKFIPKDYMTGSVEQRLQLLAGLINTDGYVVDGNIRYSTVSPQLRDDIIELARSLGFIAKEGIARIKENRYHTCYSISILGFDTLVPYLSKKHFSRYIKSKQQPKINIKTIKYIGKEECQCIYVDNPSHLYITDNYVVTHNTTFCLATAGEFQRYYKKKWEDEVEQLQAIEKPNKNEKARLDELLDNGYKKVLWLDSEHSMDILWAQKNNLDVSDIIYIKPQQESAEELLEITLNLIATGGICLLVIDSLAALTSGAALQKSLDEKTYCGISAPLTTWTSRVLPMLNKYDCTVICINQERDSIGSMYPATHTIGGRAFAYGCHCRISMRKSKPIDENYNEIAQKEESYYGNKVDVQILKNKMCLPKRRKSSFLITYDHGIYALYNYINIAVSVGLIVKTGAWYALNNENGEPLIDSEGNTMKWQGLKNVIAYFEGHDQEYEELKQKVEEIITAED